MTNIFLKVWACEVEKLGHRKYLNNAYILFLIVYTYNIMKNTLFH